MHLQEVSAYVTLRKLRRVTWIETFCNLYIICMSKDGSSPWFNRFLTKYIYTWQIHKFKPDDSFWFKNITESSTHWNLGHETVKNISLICLLQASCDETSNIIIFLF